MVPTKSLLADRSNTFKLLRSASSVAGIEPLKPLSRNSKTFKVDDGTTTTAVVLSNVWTAPTTSVSGSEPVNWLLLATRFTRDGVVKEGRSPWNRFWSTYNCCSRSSPAQPCKLPTMAFSPTFKISSKDSCSPKLSGKEPPRKFFRTDRTFR